MTCPVCGAPATDVARFCASCGHALRLPSEERRVVTVLFADLVGYTSLAETRDPEQVKNVVDRCFERLVEVIAAYGGRVDKIIGDAIVALFGAPVAHEDDAERAVRAALALPVTLDEWCATEDVPDLCLRVGVNTGEVLVGAMRAGGDYTAMGDTVNTASRLQTMAEPGRVLVGPATRQATRRSIRYTPLGAVRTRGRDEPVEAWVAEEAIGLPGARSLRNEVPLVGRESELAMLSRSVTAAVERHRAQLVLVMAEAGMGKTRLAEAVGCEAERTLGAVVLEGRCVPYGEANAWWPVAEAVRHGCSILAGAPRDEAATLTRASVSAAVGPDASDEELDRITNGLLHLMGYETGLQRIDPARAREEVVRSLLAFVDASAAQQPVIVILSDLHWADDVVLELGETLMERVASKPFVLVATARPSLLERWQPRPGRHNLVVLNLDPLGHDATGELLDALLDREPLAADLRELVLARSGGNPFFLEELVALVTDSADTGDLPHTLRGLVAARLDGLSLHERRMLEDAAVLGRQGRVEALRIMASKAHAIDDDGLVAETVESLVAKDVLVVEDGRWAFKSDLVREVAYGMLTKADRARRHAGVARWLAANEADRPESVDRIAHHYASAATMVRDLGRVDHLDLDDIRERAISWLDRAVAQAESGEVHVARRLCGQALELLDETDPQRVPFLLARARAATQLRDLTSARSDLDAAMVEAERASDDRSRAKALLCLGDLQQKEGELSVSASTLETAVAAFRDLGDPAREADALRTLGITEMFAEHHGAAEKAFTDALGLYRSLNDRRGEAWALQNLAWLMFSDGRVGEAERWLRSSAETFQEIGDRGGLGWALGLQAFVHYQQGRFDEAEALGERMLTEARDRSDMWAVGMMLVLLASLRLWTGRAAAAVEPAREAHHLFDDMHDWYGLSQAVGVLGRSLIATGQVDEGFAVLRDAYAEAKAASGQAAHRKAAVYLIHLVNAAVQVGEPDRVPEPALEGPVDGFWSEQYVSAWMLAAQRGDVDAAVGGLSELAAHSADTPYLASALALVRAAAGDGDEALAAASRVADLRGATYSDRAHALVATALVHAARQQETDARQSVRAAADVVGATDNVLLRAVVALAAARIDERLVGGGGEQVERAERALAELGVTLPGWDSLFQMALGATSCVEFS